jgi:predicted metal-dependent phosphoesterase TrpH
MPGFDLHTHSTRSDGTLTPSEVVELASTRDLAGIALTDHDTTAGLPEAREAAAGKGLEVLTGCELSAEHQDQPVHVLGYAFDPEEPLFAARREWIRAGRVRRAERIVERLRELGADVSFERVRELAGGASVGRPHIARALVEAGVVPDIPTAFSQDWIGAGGRAYVAKTAVTPVEAVGLIRGAGGVAVLAHPGVYRHVKDLNQLFRTALVAGVKGLEVSYPQDPDDPYGAGSRALINRFARVARDFGWVATGGDDFHGPSVTPLIRLAGWTKTPASCVDALLAAAAEA